MIGDNEDVLEQEVEGQDQGGDKQPLAKEPQAKTPPPAKEPPAKTPPAAREPQAKTPPPAVKDRQAPRESSVLSGEDVDDDEEEVVDDKAAAAKESAAKIPDDWREQLAGGDPIKLKALKKFGSLQGFAKSWFVQRETISKAQPGSKLPENATDEQKAEWRKANNVPETPDGYKIDPPKGIEWDDDDKAYIEAYAQFAHDNNMSVEQAKTIGDWFINEQIARRQEQAVEVLKLQKQTIKDIKQEYGKELKTLLQRARSFGTAEFGGQEEWDAIENVRLASGVTLGDYTPFIRGMIAMSEKYHETTDLFETGGEGGVAITDADFKRHHLELTTKAGNNDPRAAKELDSPAHVKRITQIYEREDASANRSGKKK